MDEEIMSRTNATVFRLNQGIPAGTVRRVRSFHDIIDTADIEIIAA
jgi:hypothetical protein